MLPNVAGYGHMGTTALTKREIGVQVSCLDGVAAVVGTAMLVIGILSLTGQLSGVVAGGCIVGLAVTLALFTVLRRKQLVWGREIRRDRIIKAIGLIGLVAMATIASLVTAGVLPKMALGVAIVTPFLTPFGLAVVWSTLSRCGEPCRKAGKLNKQPS